MEKMVAIKSGESGSMETFIRFLNEILINLIFKVMIGDNSSQPRRTNNGLPRGSTLVIVQFIHHLHGSLSMRMISHLHTKARLRLNAAWFQQET